MSIEEDGHDCGGRAHRPDKCHARMTVEIMTVVGLPHAYQADGNSGH